MSKMEETIMRKIFRRRKILRVVIIIDLPWGYEREFLLGISKYSQQYGPLELYIYVLKDKRMRCPLNSMNVDGIIAFSGDFKKNMSFLQNKIPMIAFTDKADEFYDIPTIQDDEESIGRMGAEHLLERRFKNFAFYGSSSYIWSKRRYEGFCKKISEAGYASRLCEAHGSNVSHDIQNERKKLAKWLKSLPQPLGIMACDDEYSYNVMESCKIAGLKIPWQVAILGVDNDSLLCNLTYPPISSVVMATQEAGYKAVHLLHRFMRGEEKILNQKIIIHPSYVATRLSTDILAIEDQLVLDALQLIKENVAEKIQASEIAQMLGVSRQFLHNRFIKTINRSVHDEIKRMRVERIASLLLETELPIEKIALGMGYNSINHLSRYFKQIKEMPPWDYRRKFSVKQPIII